MAKTKNHYYVLVFTGDGPVYVTHEGDRHMAYWSKDRAPKDMAKAYAEEMALGLNWNGYSAVVVWSPYEISGQPYRYDAGGFGWKDRTEEEAQK